MWVRNWSPSRCLEQQLEQHLDQFLDANWICYFVYRNVFVRGELSNDRIICSRRAPLTSKKACNVANIHKAIGNNKKCSWKVCRRFYHYYYTAPSQLIFSVVMNRDSKSIKAMVDQNNEGFIRLGKFFFSARDMSKKLKIKSFYLLIDGYKRNRTSKRVIVNDKKRSHQNYRCKVEPCQ